MKPFTFRLTTLLKLREATRDERRARLAEAFQAAAILERRVEELEAERAAGRASYLAAGSPGAVAVEQLVDVERYDLLLGVELQQLARQRALLEAEIDVRRQALVAADQDVRVLEKLREKQQQRHRHDAARLESKRFDEIGVRSAAMQIRAADESAGGSG